ncbi:MAG: hypothetical protein E7624_00325 [Ruminococcaceae bacterium]|nr:hypothetical protein [Oscillospiraceae bacterium]
MDVPDFILFFLFFVSAALAVLIPILHEERENTLGEIHIAHKRTLLQSYLLFAIVAFLLVCCFLLSYVLSSAVLTLVGVATRIPFDWSDPHFPVWESILLSFFNILSFIALFLLVSTLCRKKRFAIPINVLLFGLSLQLHFSLQHNYSVDTVFTPAIREELRILSFLSRLNPGTFAIEVANPSYYTTEEILKMLHASLLFTLPVVALALLAAHAKDVLARRKGRLD